MYIFNDGVSESFSVFYPIFARGKNTLRVIPWQLYRKFMVVSCFISVALFSFALILLTFGIVGDTLYSVFSGSAFLAGMQKLYVFRAKATVKLTRIKSRKNAPIAVVLDFSLYFFALGCMEILFARTSHYMVGPLALAALIFIFLALAPIINYLVILLSSSSKIDAQ
ncbi:MAG: hypothetical protein V4484_21055 [Pseudomonadota bacterium]